MQLIQTGIKALSQVPTIWNALLPQEVISMTAHRSHFLWFIELLLIHLHWASCHLLLVKARSVRLAGEWTLKDSTDIFLISVYGLHARGIQSPNAMIGMLVFFGGTCQFIAGIMEFITGNTVSSILDSWSYVHLLTIVHTSSVLQSSPHTALLIYPMPWSTYPAQGLWQHTSTRQPRLLCRSSIRQYQSFFGCGLLSLSFTQLQQWGQLGYCFSI